MTTRSPVPVQAAQYDPPPGDEEDQEDVRDNRDIIIEDERIVVEAGGATPITLAEDQLLDDQVGTGAKTPSGVSNRIALTDEHGFTCHFTSGK